MFILILMIADYYEGTTLQIEQPGVRYLSSYTVTCYKYYDEPEKVEIEEPAAEYSQFKPAALTRVEILFNIGAHVRHVFSYG